MSALLCGFCGFAENGRVRVVCMGRYSLASLCEGGVSYGGIAAEIGAKNMPPACFLNAPTEGEN